MKISTRLGVREKEGEGKEDDQAKANAETETHMETKRRRGEGGRGVVCWRLNEYYQVRKERFTGQ